MRTDCHEVQSALVSGGPHVLRDDEAAQRHVSECTACFEFLEAVAELETSLTSLPRLDAPPSAVEALLARLELVTQERRRRSRMWMGAIAAGIVLAVLAPILWHGRRPPERIAARVTLAPVTPDKPVSIPPPRRDGARGPVADRAASRPARFAREESIFTEIDSVGSALTARGPDPVPPLGQPKVAEPLPPGERHGGGLKVRVYDMQDNSPMPGALVELSHASGGLRPQSIQSNAEGEAVFPDLRAGGGYQVKVSFPGSAPAVVTDQRVEIDDTRLVVVGLFEQIKESVNVFAQREVVELESTSVSPKFSDEFVKDLPIAGRFHRNVLTLAPGIADDDGDGNAAVHGSRVGDFKVMVGGVGNVDPLIGLSMNSINPDSIEEIDVVSSDAGIEYGRPLGGFSTLVPAPGTDAVRAFFEERSSIHDLRFTDAKGYWANSYLPGDPALRLLAARLFHANRASLPASFHTTFRLHDGSRRPPQPFDAPEGAALAVYLSADHRNLGGESRMLVQVGIEGTPRRGGRRPAMNLGVVLDLRGEIPIETATSMRALVGAIAAAREQGDRLNLVVAGRPGGLVIGPESFRHGPLMVALDRLLAGATPEGESLGVVEAMTKAIETVASVDDPDRPLGSSAVLLVTGQPLGAFTSTISDLAHQSAVAGFPVSVVGIGTGVIPDDIDRVSLSGHGRRRLMRSAAEASGLIDRELSAVTRAIAGAVRLRIRLAAGVKLVDVLGSSALDEKSAQRVRSAEKSIDLRLARNLGVTSDRGDDEDGIQIFIPSFYASDTHVILLDVVAAGPGPIADVQLRYKDLVALRNSVARATLRVGRGTDVTGPIERNALKNLLALRLSDTLEKAGSALAGGDRPRAGALLGQLRDLLAGFRREVPGFENDPDLAGDIGMLAEYVALLDDRSASGPATVAYLADSLRYAARLKVLPRPVSD